MLNRRKINYIVERIGSLCYLLTIINIILSNNSGLPVAHYYVVWVIVDNNQSKSINVVERLFFHDLKILKPGMNIMNEFNCCYCWNKY